ncbi:hypothetical protein [Limnoglobus roseus]|uniref:Uncharacterized protein n=1 Tax=Limnoglobus roseus TaxID=2598579 RepID=A0A5C1AA03_9BACT|nr:hypothetical protein [Limnoglobus roseus]QEL14642.1 hypothetical protein PX52LOC_01534 [Limnoglobus roseus]
MGKRARNKRFRRQLAEARLREPVPPPPRTEAEAALWWLTGGHVPTEHCFLAAERFCIWSPERADLLITCISDGDPAVHEACRAFLRRSGAAFPTVEAVRAEVRRRGLPGAPAAEPSMAPDPAAR